MVTAQHARGRCVYGVYVRYRACGPGPQAALCPRGTYSTQEAGTRSPYEQYGGPRAYLSARAWSPRARWRLP
eukprot:scaffold31897_cov58-Phaeocystis_antarctica.AAC.8